MSPVLREGWQRLATGCPTNCRPGGWRAFQAGLFWMPSSALIGGVLLLLSLTLWAPTHQPKPLSRATAKLLLGLSALMVVTTAAAAPSLTLEQQLRIGNWLPFFWFFLALPPYLATSSARNRAAMAFVAGTVPIALVGLSQAALGFSGPWQALGGLLDWPLPQLYASRGAGVFPNPNFTAAWYVIVLPLAAAQMLRWRGSGTSEWPFNTTQTRRLATGVLLLIGLALYVCGSRNALLVAPISLLALSWQSFALPVLVVYGGLAALLGVALWGQHLTGALAGLHGLATWITGNFNWKLNAMLSHRSGTVSDPLRQELYPKALRFINSHPWLGGGERLLPGSPASLSEPSGLTHLHSLPLQFAINHGLPALMLLTALVGWLLMRAGRRLWQLRHQGDWQQRLVDRSLLLAALTAVWLHVLDIPSFDSRINVLGWVLLAASGVLGAAPPSATGHSAGPADS